MAKKFIRVGENKAFNVEGILMGEDQEPHVSVRQMYKTKKDPKWKPSRNGFTIPQQYAGQLARAIGLTSQEDPSGFTLIQTKAEE